MVELVGLFINRGILVTEVAAVVEDTHAAVEQFWNHDRGDTVRQGSDDDVTLSSQLVQIEV